MRIKLLKDWDFFPSVEKQTGHFTGRKLLKERLFNEIIRRNSGAILLSGSRGVGKTALVYESLRNVKEKIKERNIESGIKINKIIITKITKSLNLIFFRISYSFPKIAFDYPRRITLLPIIINASQLDLNSIVDDKQKINNQLIRKEIIVMLIRGLYAAVEKNGRTKLELVEDIYKKALATEYRISQDVMRSQQYNYGFKGEIKVNFDGMLSLAASLLISGIVFGVSYFLIGAYLNVDEVFRYIFSFIPSIGVLTFVIFVNKKHEKSDTERETYIRDDNSVTNLEILLEKVLEKLSRYFKPVFIIDELDYLEKTTLNEGSQVPIINLIKTYKNLFNLVDAIFIFIAGQETWNKLQESARKDIQHTLFTSNVFLPKPEFSDIKDYIKIISPEIKKWDKKEEKMILNYLVYKSKAEFFDLKNVVNNNMTKYLADDSPIFEIVLNQISTRQSKVQEAIEVLFNYQKYKEFEKNEKNYNLLELIYKVCDFITPDENFIIAKKERWEVIIAGENVYTTADSWFKNLINTLEWLKLIENVYEQDVEDNVNPPVTPTPEIPVTSNIYKLTTYRWTGRTPNIPNKINQIETEEMKEFKEEFRKLNRDILTIFNTLNYLSKGSRSILNEDTNSRISKFTLEAVSKLTNVTLRSFYSENYNFLIALKKDVPEYVDAVELNKKIQNIKEVRNNFYQDTNQLLAKLVTEAATNRQYAPNLYTEYDNPQFLGGYPKLTALLGGSQTNLIINSSSTNRNILVGSNIDITKLENSGSMSNIKANNNLRLIVINPVASKTTRKTTSKILIEITTEKLAEGLINSKEGRTILTKIIQFLHWEFN